MYQYWLNSRPRFRLKFDPRSQVQLAASKVMEDDGQDVFWPSCDSAGGSRGRGRGQGVAGGQGRGASLDSRGSRGRGRQGRGGRAGRRPIEALPEDEDDIDSEEAPADDDEAEGDEREDDEGGDFKQCTGLCGKTKALAEFQAKQMVCNECRAIDRSVEYFVKAQGEQEWYDGLAAKEKIKLKKAFLKQKKDACGKRVKFSCLDYKSAIQSAEAKDGKGERK